MAARIYLFIIIFGVCGSIGYAGYSYYVQMQEKVIQLSKNNSKLKLAIETSEASINASQEQNKKNEASALLSCSDSRDDERTETKCPCLR